MDTTLHEYIVFSTDAESINSPAFYDCIIHLLCTAGSGSFWYNEQRFEIVSGNIAVLSHPRLVKIENISGDFSCQFIAAPEKFLHNLLPANNYSIQGCVSLFSNPIIKVNEEDAGRFQIDLNNIRRRADDINHRFYPEMIGSLLQTMIYDLFDFHSKNNYNILTTDRVGYFTAQFFSMIEAGRSKTEREVSYYARQLNVTSKYLSDTIKRVTGYSASTHINRAAASIIMEYLKDNRLSISQIADEMNFASLSYFSRFCAKHLGISPTKYRLAGAKK